MAPKYDQLETIDEATETETEAAIEIFREDLNTREQNDEEYYNSEIQSRNSEAVNKLIAELNDNPLATGNVANQAASRIDTIYNNDPLVRIKELHRGMDEILGIPPEGSPVAERLIADDSAASNQFDRGSDNPSRCQKLLPIISCLLVIAIMALIVYGISQAVKSKSSAADPDRSSDADQPLDQTPIGHRLINLSSLAMEAAADRPNHFQKLGITDACYAQFRQAIIDGQFNVPESLWWQLLADQALHPYPQTDILLTPANHYMALSFCLDCLKPLYPAQPLDLDVDETIDTLASSLNLLDPSCMAGYYSRMLEVIPESSGANRAQRIFLARAGLARAFSRMPA